MQHLVYDMLVPLEKQPKFNQYNFRISKLYQLQVLLSRQLIGDHILSLDPWLKGGSQNPQQTK